MTIMSGFDLMARRSLLDVNQLKNTDSRSWRSTKQWLKHDCWRVSSSFTTIPSRPLKKGLVMFTSISVCHTGHNWQTYWIPFLAYRCAYTHLRITSIPRCTPRNSQVSALFYNCWWASELCRLGRWIQVGGGHGILHQVLPTLAHLWLWKRTVDAYHVQTSKVVNHTTTWYPAAHFRLKLVVCL